jgi:hypothetical protein
MDEPKEEQEQPQERTVTPAEVWEVLPPDIQARVVSLIARMACKHVLAQYKLLSEEPERGTDNVSSMVEFEGTRDLP